MIMIVVVNLKARLQGLAVLWRLKSQTNVRFDQLNWLPLHQIWWLRASGLYCKIGHLSRGGMAD